MTGCTPPDRGDPKIPECSITEQPADLGIRNFHAEQRTLTVRVERNNSTVLLSKTATVPSNATRTFSNVFDRPGTYRINAIVDDDLVQSETLQIGRRYEGQGGVEWEVVIDRSGGIVIRREPDF